MNPRVAVTGASGFLGHALVEHLLASGEGAITLGRGTSDVSWDLRDTSAPTLTDVRAIVHCAWAVTPRTRAVANTNIAGSLALLDEARRLEVPFVFLSSMSSSATTRSRYGRSKRAVEEYVLEYERGRVIRPGTIQDASGNIGMLGESLARLGNLPIGLHVAPNPQLPIVSLDRVVSAVIDNALQTAEPEREIDLVDTWISVDELVSTVAGPQRSSRALTVSGSLVTGGCEVVRAIGIPGVRDLADSWLGLVDAGRRRSTTSL